MKIKLKDLLSNIPLIETTHENIKYELPIGNLTVNSQNQWIEKDRYSIFVAIRGTNVDGHKFIPDAIANGHKIIVYDTIPDENVSDYFGNEVIFIKVLDTSKALSLMASNFFGNPVHKLKVIGVTGTNGKTTVATLLHKLTQKLGYKSGLISTVCIKINDEVFPTKLTTPDPIELHRNFRRMLDSGCEFCFMEVSSHALAQERVFGINFTGAIFTNLTHDHLDYHTSFSNYLNSKKLLFDGLKNSAFAISNLDDKNGNIMLQNTAAQKKYYSINTKSDYFGKILESQLIGMELDINNQQIWFKLVGLFNAYNLLAVWAAANELGFDPEDSLVALSSFDSVEGRFEVINFPNNIFGVVDYAHTPDALDNVLRTLEEVNHYGGRIITVIGCGGNRDKTKRPEMAKIAAMLSNFVILTSDNPRFENPELIITDMLDSIDEITKLKIKKIVLRKEAINYAVEVAQQNDIILVAGKGHESYQEIEGVRYPFNDKEELKLAFLKKHHSLN